MTDETNTGVITMSNENASQSAERGRAQLSVVMPVYNEVRLVEQILALIRSASPDCEIVIVDDGSTDGTQEILKRLEGSPGLRIFCQPTNSGKGAALQRGFALACGACVIVQDADLEYDPGDYAALVEPLLDGTADVVYGSRFMPGAQCRMARHRRWANQLITWFFNRVMHQRLSDVETCYKVLRREILEQVADELVENRFGIEIELSARIAKLPGIRIVERPVRYSGRTREEGKKIRWTDGLRALWCIWKYR
jgi:glycosyltransferase involved in cell wall biosynthesis